MAASGPVAGRRDIGPRVVVAAAFAAVVAAGVALRAFVLASSLGLQNSDEAHTGIESLELLRGHAWVFVPGTSYGGNAEAWLDAPFAWLLGASPLRTKVLTSLLWLVAAAACACALRSRGWRAALAAGAVIWLPSAALLLLSTLAYPGYASGLLATSVAIALATPAVDGVLPSSRRAFGVGLAATFAVWMHPLFLLTAGVFAAALALRHLRHAGRVAAPLAVGGAVAAALPLWHNARNGWPSLHPPVVPTASYPERARGWVEDLFPRAVGQKFVGPWIVGGASRGVAVVLLLALAAGCALVLWRGRTAARVAAGALLASPLVLTGFANTEHTADGRYAVMVLPLAAVVVAEALTLAPWRLLVGPRAALLLTGWVVLATGLPLATRLWLVPPAPEDTVAIMRDINHLQPLLQVLRERHVDAVRADYWVAYRITYGSDEEVVASPLIAASKFPRYDARVRAAEAAGTAALVLSLEQVPELDAGTLSGGALSAFRPYDRRTVGPWTVFLPPPPSRP